MRGWDGGVGAAGVRYTVPRIPDLTPPPAFLSFLIEGPRAADQYLLWTIAEGGAPFGTEMPAYKDHLTESEIWQIISWMRAGFPEIGG